MQLTHTNSKFKKRQFPIILVCDGVTNAANIGSLFRVADAFGIEQLVLCGDAVSIVKRIRKTSRATEQYVTYTIETDINLVIEQLKADNYQVIALEITNNSVPLHQFKFDTTQAISLIIGNENFGVSDTVLKHCDAVIHIDMFGHNSSMNVVQATSIVMYEMTRQMEI